jgi:hypothetical protein
MTNDIARFEYSTDEAFYYVLEFVSGPTLTGRSFEVLVKDRASNTVRATLTLGSGLTMVSATEISAAVTRPAMVNWPRGEYQADLVDITGGARSRIMAVRFVYDYPGNLVYGVRDRKAFVNWSPNKAYVTATGAVGPVGPPGLAATVAVGDITTVAPGEPADVRNSGTTAAAILDFDIPAGAAATVTVGDVETVAPGEPADVRNSGTATAAVLDFDIPAGTAATVAVGDVTTVAPGEPADVRNSGTASAAVLDFDIPEGEKGDTGDKGDAGNAGWSPVLATISDGARRVHQVIDWTGGEGAKPATGDYIGLTGLVPNIADGIDIRGPAGTATIPDGDKGDVTTSDDGGTWTLNGGAVGNLNEFIGGAGGGGAKGVVPAPATGDTAKFLRGDGVWADTAIQPFSPGFLSGLRIRNDNGDLNNDIAMEVGGARSDDNTSDIVLQSDVIKQIDAPFAEYSSPSVPSGGRDPSDTLTGSKWFNVFLIGGNGKSSQPFFSTSLTPTLPAGFTVKRRVTSVYWTGAAIRAFTMRGRAVFWNSPPALDIDTSALGTTSQTSTVSVPIGTRVVHIANSFGSNSGSACIIYVRCPDHADLAPSVTAAPLASIGANSGQAAITRIETLTNASGQISYRAFAASTVFRVATLGWYELD